MISRVKLTLVVFSGRNEKLSFNMQCGSNLVINKKNYLAKEVDFGLVFIKKKFKRLI